MKHSKKDITNLGDIYQSTVNNYKSPVVIEEQLEEVEAVEEVSEVILNRRKKYTNVWRSIMEGNND